MPNWHEHLAPALAKPEGKVVAPLLQGECNLPTMEPARKKEISRPTGGPFSSVWWGVKAEEGTPGSQEPLLLHSGTHFLKRLHPSSKTPKSRAACPVLVAPLAFPTEQPQHLSGL